MSPVPLAAGAVGFALPGVLGVDAGGALDICAQAVDAGCDPVLLTEVCGFHAPALAGAIAAARPGHRLGTAILPLGSRSTATIAMAATTVAQVSGAPFLLGLGTSSPQIVADWHGRPHDPTIATTRRRLAAVRSLLDGGSRGSFRIPVPAGGDVRLLLAALGPRMTALALEAADGLILNHAPPATVPAAPDTHDVLAFVWVTAAPDGPVRARRDLTAYVMAPPYARHFRRLGHGDVVDRVQALHADGRLRDAPGVLPAAMVDRFYVAPDDLARRCAHYRDAGAVPVIVPVTGDDPVGEVGRLLAARPWKG